MGSTVKKIALLSGGGDCPGLNAVIRTITKTAISKYGYEVITPASGYLACGDTGSGKMPEPETLYLYIIIIMLN